MRAKVSKTGQNLVSRLSKTDRERAVEASMMPSSSPPNTTTLQFEVFCQDLPLRPKGADEIGIEISQTSHGPGVKEGIFATLTKPQCGNPSEYVGRICCVGVPIPWG